MTKQEKEAHPLDPEPGFVPECDERGVEDIGRGIVVGSGRAEVERFVQHSIPEGLIGVFHCGLAGGISACRPKNLINDAQ